MADGASFETQRSKLVKLYEKAGQPFKATTFPYTSTVPLVFDVVEPYPAIAPTMAHLVARGGQQLFFFAYGAKTPQDDGFGNTYQATAADTNQQTPNQTNSNQDYVIEGISLTARDKRIIWDPAVLGANTMTDKDVISAYFGPGTAIGGVKGSPLPVPIIDPASLMSPVQIDNPLNLQELLARCFPLLAVTFQWNKQDIQVIGTLDQLPEGGGKAPIFANGDARVDNRFKIPEGYLWRRAGEPDSTFNAIVTVAQPIVIPVSLVGLFGATAEPQAGFPVPLQVALDIKMRVHGLACQIPGQN